MANGDKEKEGMGHGMCMGCGMCGHHWSHMVIRVLIVLFIFWAGMEFGEVRAMLRADGYGGYGQMMMSDGGNPYGGMRGGMGMMDGRTTTSVVSPANPQAPVPTVTPATPAVQ
jgi:hypothetical protein